MFIVSTKKETKDIIKMWIKEDKTIGFVPTMGYLHKGHMSLIERARKENDKVVVSIFVNPIQFGPNEDYENYPKDFESDSRMCQAAGVDLIFSPSVSEMYKVPILAYTDVDKLGDFLCGTKRPGHFRGVCTVVSKLFNIITPTRAYFGEKDFQQLSIIKRMAYDLDFDVDIISCPTVRERDGLAMSSRNVCLSTEERIAAHVVPKSLECAKEAIDRGERDVNTIKKIIMDELYREPRVRVDYVEVVDMIELAPVNIICTPVVVAVAVYVGKTRLTDNFYCEV